ncbi:MAG TPA: hypothetical protein VGU46_09960 [Acidobacteriaceae bacterium]|nr:hypothetical protein [Acidobacteriaceae bacterium]
MSDQDLAVFLATIERLRRERGSDPEKARAMLVEEGILNPDGQLAEPYRS